MSIKQHFWFLQIRKDFILTLLTPPLYLKMVTWFPYSLLLLPTQKAYSPLLLWALHPNFCIKRNNTTSICDRFWDFISGKAIASSFVLPDNSCETSDTGTFLFPKMTTTAWIKREKKKQKQQKKNTSSNKSIFLSEMVLYTET